MSGRSLAGIRVGVAGVGYWGSKHVRVLRSTPGVSDVVPIDPQLAIINENDRRGIHHGYASLNEALPYVDALVIATPPSNHAPQALHAIATGKHVLIEKPMAGTVAEARQIVSAAEEAGVVLMSGHTFEHNAAVHKLRDIIRSQELGELYYLDCARLNLGLYQADVNVISDLAPHDISIANFLLDSAPTTVTAWGRRHVHPDHEDVAHLRIDYANQGVCVTINVSWLDPQKVRRIKVVGSRKMAIYDDLAGDERVRVYDKAAVPPEGDDGPLSRVAYRLGDVVAPYVAFPEPLAVQDQHFVDCVLQGTQPSTDGRSGLTVVEVLECAQISLQEQRTVALAEVRNRLEDRVNVRLPAST